MYQHNPQQYQPHYPVQPPRPTDGLAIASLVCGIAWLGWAGSIVAVIFAHISIHKARQEHRPASGMAVAGLVLGYIGLATLLVFILLTLVAAAGSSGS